ncbi:MAG: restriction endonuclease subunit S [Anaerolineaceae bacterium]|nr:restriction endonuclease subunit S [Anaerolineaceae bacterium]
MANPKTRFKRDDGSDYPDWEEISVGEITAELTDYLPLNCGYPLLTSSRNGLLFQEEFRNKVSTENEETIFSVLPRNAVTYRHMSDDNIFHFNINTLVDYGLVSKEYPVFTTINGNNLYLLVEYLNSSDRFLEFCKAQKKGGTRTRLYFNILKTFKTFFPLPEEQQKIADFLTKVDEVIAGSEAEVRNLEAQKKAVMKKIFAQEIRFIRPDGSNFPNWKEDRLNNLCEYVDYRGKTPEKVEKGIFLVTAKNIRMGYIDYDVSQEFISEDSYEEVMHRGKPNIGDVLFTTEAPCGMVAQVDRDDIALAQRVIKYRSKDNNSLNNTYLKYILISDMFQDNLAQKATGGTVKGIKGAVLHEMIIIYPSDIKEQRLIADFLSDFDDAIAAAKKELELWKQLKKALLQQMFV